MEWKSQLGQDKWVVETIAEKRLVVNNPNTTQQNRDFFYLDIGAFDGLRLSNTYVLDKLGWKGICVEANPKVFQRLVQNRPGKNTICIQTALASTSGKKITFHMGEELSFCEGGGGVNPTTSEHIQQVLGEEYQKVEMTTQTIDDVLKVNTAPSIIDYLSIDVEGMELDILGNFPFEKYHVNLLTVEHNEPHVGPEYRQALRDLLTRKGFAFVKGNDPVPGWKHGPIEDFYENSEIRWQS